MPTMKFTTRDQKCSMQIIETISSNHQIPLLRHVKYNSINEKHRELRTTIKSVLKMGWNQRLQMDDLR